MKSKLRSVAFYNNRPRGIPYLREPEDVALISFHSD